jgi:hypothetical protein
MVARRYAKVLEVACDLQLPKFSSRHTFKSDEPLNTLSASE